MFSEMIIFDEIRRLYLIAMIPIVMRITMAITTYINVSPDAAALALACNSNASTKVVVVVDDVAVAVVCVVVVVDDVVRGIWMQTLSEEIVPSSAI